MADHFNNPILRDQTVQIKAR